MPAITAQNSASVMIRAIVDGLITGITDAVLSCVSAFGAVTLTFAIMERKKGSIRAEKGRKMVLRKSVGRKQNSNFPLPLDAKILRSLYPIKKQS